MKKKIGAITVAVVLVVFITAATAFAAGTGRNFVDIDGDGICDLRDERSCVSKNCFENEITDRVCDFQGRQSHFGRGWGCGQNRSL
ncbi:hypothetical protein [uncultured Ruthenibacterium sp.]|uniref:hypothetical protein n=1 Tax=uncultured Ruthenibacterium sp. TaxID=1905347 RepID=UPI00349E864B